MADKKLGAGPSGVIKNSRGKHIQGGQRLIAHNIFVKYSKTEGVSKSQAVKRTAEEVGISISMVWKIVKEMKEKGCVNSPPKKRVYSVIYDKLNEQHKNTLRQIVFGFINNNETPSLNKIFQEVQENGTLPPISRTSLWRTLMIMGFYYEKKESYICREDSTLSLKNYKHDRQIIKNKQDTRLPVMSNVDQCQTEKLQEGLKDLDSFASISDHDKLKKEEHKLEADDLNYCERTEINNTQNNIKHDPDNGTDKIQEELNDVLQFIPEIVYNTKTEENDIETVNFNGEDLLGTSELKSVNEESQDLTEVDGGYKLNEPAELNLDLLFAFKNGDPRFGLNRQRALRRSTHNNEKLHVCDICQMDFTQSHSLKRHKFTHTGERPYVCNVCSKSFTQNHNLMRHKLTHTGTKPYVCDVCNKIFDQSFFLIRHKRIHISKTRTKHNLQQTI